jgi:capsid assembly protease
MTSTGRDQGWRLMAAHTWALSDEAFQRHAEQLSVEAAARAAMPTREIRGAGERNIGVVPIIGTMMYRSGYFSGLLGATSTKDATQAVLTHRFDPNVDSIVLVVDSGGGETTGVCELAQEIRAAAASKPVTAMIDGAACSAAYWAISGASEIVMMPSGLTGSIGVFALHLDQSRLLDRIGIVPTFVRAGRFKADLNELEPLTKEARTALQRQVDDCYSTFVGDVAKGRKVNASDVRDGFGEGRTVTAKEALRLNMIDRIDTLTATIQRVARESRGRGARAVASVEQDHLRRRAKLRRMSMSMLDDTGGRVARELAQLRSRARARSMELSR